jgi:hypothetical protein
VLEVDQNQDLYHPERTAREDIHDSQRLEWDSYERYEEIENPNNMRAVAPVF